MRTGLFRFLAVGALAGATSLLVSCGTPGAAPSSGPFQAQYDASLREPEIQVRNQADRMVTLQGWGPKPFEMKISPGTTQSLSLPAGSYRYHGSARNVLPADGTAAFQAKNRYVWTFYIR